MINGRVVVGSERLCSILKKRLLRGITSLFDLKNKAYELSVLWQRSRHAKEPNRNGSKPSFSFLVRFYLFLTWEIKLWSTRPGPEEGQAL